MTKLRVCIESLNCFALCGYREHVIVGSTPFIAQSRPRDAEWMVFACLRNNNDFPSPTMSKGK